MVSDKWECEAKMKETNMYICTYGEVLIGVTHGIELSVAYKLQ